MSKVTRTYARLLAVGVLTSLFALAPISFAGAQTATISTSLDIGSTGPDVTTLQTFLAKDPSIYPQGLVTGYFGSLTSAAVKNFQARYGIDVVGRVGPITRDKINSLIISGGFGGTGTAGVGVAPAIYNIASSSASNQDGTRSQTITWSTDRNTRGKLFYSTTPLTFTETNSPTGEPFVSGSVVTDDTYGVTKSLSVSNLPAATSYYYMIEAIDANGHVSVTWPNMFRTP
jgi:peptidoglycan hydrolase-like protein with peptidoglycan-binding domain